MLNKEFLIDLNERVVEYCFYAIIFLVPLFFNPFSFLGFEVDKIILFRLMTELALFFFLLKILTTGKLELPKAKNFYLTLVSLLVIQVLSTIFSPHVYQGLWGSYWRRMGLFTYFHLYVFAFLILVYPVKIKNFFYTAALSGFLASLYGLVQVAGFDFLKWQEVPNGLLARASSTLGQPNFLGAFLLFTLPSTFYLIWQSRSVLKRIFLGLAAFIELLALYFTFSRSAWLGLLAAGTVFAGWYLVSRFKRRAAWLSVLLMAFLFIFLLTSFLKKTDNTSLPLIGRLSTIFATGSGSAGIRLYYYEAASNIIKESPLVGHGLDTQGLYFATRYEPYYAALEKINTYPDRAHNEILDVLITTGLAGLAAWFLLIYLFFRSFLNRQRRLVKEGKIIGPPAGEENSEKSERNESLLFCLLSGVVGLVIYLMFSFFSIVDAIYFWLFIACTYKVMTDSSWKFDWTLKVPKPAKIILSIICLGFLLLLSYQFNFRLALAEIYNRQARLAEIKGDFAGAFGKYSKALDLLPDEDYFPTQMAAELEAPISSLADEGIKKTVLDNLKENLSKIKEKNLTMEGKTALAIILGKLGETQEAEKLFNELTRHYPGFARLYLYWGNFYSDQKKFGLAREKYFSALELYPNLGNPDLNDEHRADIKNEMLLVFKNLAEAEMGLKHYKNAEKYNRAALGLYPFDFELYTQKIRILAMEEDEKRLYQTLSHLAVIYPANNDVRQKLELLKDQIKNK